MTKRNGLAKTIGFLKDCDDMVHVITGKRIPYFVKRGIDLYGDDLKKKAAKAMSDAMNNEPEDSPYRILHCRPDAGDVVVKARYRSLCKELHPDTGTHPDEKEFDRVVNAYKEIMKAREGRTV